VKADPHAQSLLLDLQAIDTALGQLAHRRAHLPELAELAALGRTLSAMEDERLRAQSGVDDLDRDIARLERDVEQVRSRKDRDAARLTTGTGPAKELEALQHEVESLTRRQSVLEDSELELMERREEAQAKLDGIAAKLAEARAQRTGLEERRDAALGGIAAEEAARMEARQPLVDQVPADLLALYERIRDDSGGIGAALLRAGRCGGCRLELAGNEQARVRAAPPDEVLRCEECRRIMVRDAESGL
jgi:predicted  nucleic acid-binding Zn-ribbon protein